MSETQNEQVQISEDIEKKTMSETIQKSLEEPTELIADSHQPQSNLSNHERNQPEIIEKQTQQLDQPIQAQQHIKQKQKYSSKLEEVIQDETSNNNQTISQNNELTLQTQNYQTTKIVQQDQPVSQEQETKEILNNNSSSHIPVNQNGQDLIDHQQVEPIIQTTQPIVLLNAEDGLKQQQQPIIEGKIESPQNTEEKNEKTNVKVQQTEKQKEQQPTQSEQVTKNQEQSSKTYPEKIQTIPQAITQPESVKSQLQQEDQSQQSNSKTQAVSDIPPKDQTSQMEGEDEFGEFEQDTSIMQQDQWNLNEKLKQLIASLPDYSCLIRRP